MSTVQKDKESLWTASTQDNWSIRTMELVQIYLIGPYYKSIRQQQTGGVITKKDVILTYMTKIDPTTGWFKIVEVPWFDLNEAARVNSEYIYKLSSRLSQMSNQTFLCRYLCPKELFFDNGYKFKWYFTPVLKDFSITPMHTSI